MRSSLLVAVLGLSLAGCAHTAWFRPATDAQAVPGQPEAASVETAGVRMVVHAGDWRGWPEDLEERLTPVEVYLENGSGKRLRVDPVNFALIAPNGFRYQALEPKDIQRLAGPYYRAHTVMYYGWWGAYPWPGFWGPWRHHHYPYVWWGAFPPPPYAGWAPPEGVMPAAAPKGELESGGNISVLLFFPVPSVSLTSMQLAADLVDHEGNALGNAQVQLVRAGTGHR